MFFYTLSSLEPLLFYHERENFFFKVTLQTREKYSRTEKVLHSPYSGTLWNQLVYGDIAST